jgi:hypothetical protein
MVVMKGIAFIHLIPFITYYHLNLFAYYSSLLLLLLLLLLGHRYQEMK